jgi:hypothetical protein
LFDDLAAVARRNLARFPASKVVTAAFEDWPLPSEPFDLVLAATAFHWIDPAVRLVKAADVPSSSEELDVWNGRQPVRYSPTFDQRH